MLFLLSLFTRRGLPQNRPRQISHFAVRLVAVVAAADVSALINTRLLERNHGVFCFITKLTVYLSRVGKMCLKPPLLPIVEYP